MSRCRRPAGNRHAPAYLYPAFVRDTVAIALGQGHTAYGRYAKESGQCVRRGEPAAYDRARAARAGSRDRARVAKVGRARAARHDRRLGATARARHRPRATGRRARPRAPIAAAPGEEHAADVAPQGTGDGRRGRRHWPKSGEHAGGHVIPGDASMSSSPGSSAGRQRRAGRARRSRDRTKSGMYDPNHPERDGEASVGDDHRPRALHRLLGVCDGVLRGEQHSDGRCRLAERAVPTRLPRHGPGANILAVARDGLDAHSSATSRARRKTVQRGFRHALRADALPALRQRAVRAGLPRVRDVSRARRAERAGLQPLRRHALLLQQLPVQGSLLQLVRVRRDRTARSTRSRSRSTGSSIPTSRCAARA